MIVAADADGIAAAVAALAAGGIVALPTETVYGVAADATDADAVAKIFAAKGRPGFNPLIVHVADLDAAGALVDINATARALAARFWPGPLTLVLPARTGNGIAPAVAAGLPTLAIRIPAHPIMQAVLRGVGASRSHTDGRDCCLQTLGPADERTHADVRKRRRDAGVLSRHRGSAVVARL